MRNSSTALLTLLITLGGSGCTRRTDSLAPLDLRVLVRSSKPSFAVGEPVKFDVACIGIATWSSRQRRAHWNDACKNVTLEIERARINWPWGYGEPMPWLPNSLMTCLPAVRERPHGVWTYSKPEWHSISVPREKVSGLRGVVLINVRSVLIEDGKQLYQDSRQLITSIVGAEDREAEMDLDRDIRQNEYAVRSGDQNTSERLADELLGIPTMQALAAAVRLFDNTKTTASLWRVIESSPYQQEALELMQNRLKDTYFVPDYELLQAMTGMKARLDRVQEYDAAGLPYPEYHPELEAASVKYFRFLLNLAAHSTQEPNSARATAILKIVESIVRTETCSLGTLGLSSGEAAALTDMIRGAKAPF